VLRSTDCEKGIRDPMFMLALINPADISFLRLFSMLDVVTSKTQLSASYSSGFSGMQSFSVNPARDACTTRSAAGRAQGAAKETVRSPSQDRDTLLNVWPCSMQQDAMGTKGIQYVCGRGASVIVQGL